MIEIYQQALPHGLTLSCVPQLTLERVSAATHWIIHERPAFVAQRLQAFLEGPLQ